MRRLHAIAKENGGSPEQIFITQVATGENITYHEIWRVSCQLASLLADYHVGPQTRVVLLARNHWAMYPLMIACSLLGAVLVPLDPLLHPEELRSILAHAAPRLIIFDDKEGKTSPSDVTSVSLTSLIDAARSGTAPEPTSLGEQGEKLLQIYTSGTTGGAKAVLLTEQNLVASALSLKDRYQPTEADRFYCILPTYHMNAVMITGLLPFVARSRVFLADVFSFKNAKFYWNDIARNGITICSLVPSIMSLLLKLWPKGAPIPMSVRFGFCGAAPLPGDVWRRFEAVFNFPIYQGYGLTETTCWAAATRPNVPHSYDSVGSPLACEFLIDSTKNIEPAEGWRSSERGDPPPGAVVGEVLIRGPLVMAGYYKNDPLTRSSITPEGYLRTGDLGFFNSDGELVINGRIKDIIIRNGVNVSSRDLDELLTRHRQVQESKTFGLPDEMVGERVHVACVVKPEAAASSAPELTRWISSRVSEHQRPDMVHVMGYLPKSPTGKISMNQLRKIFSGQLADEVFEALNRKKYRRAQPHDPDGIRSRIQDVLVSGSSLKFVAHWGCGKRARLNDVDKIAMDQLISWMSLACKTQTFKVELTLLLTDIHAMNNSKPERIWRQYFSEVKAYAATRNVDCVYLSELWDSAGLKWVNVAEDIKDPAFQANWEKLPVRQELIEQAHKHFEQESGFEQAAMRYLRACSLEAEPIRVRFHDRVLLTYNPPEMDLLLPELPRMYLFSIDKGTSMKPWFVGEGDDLAA